MKRFLAAVLLVFLVFPVFAEEKNEDPVVHRLFHIERNKNTNIVVYDALTLAGGDLLDEDPVIVYWLKLAEGGHRKDLKGIEKRMAYGFSVKEREGNRLTLEMKADVGRDVTVEPRGESYNAFMDINGRRAVVEKIYIFAKEGGLLPSVEYLELFGKDPDTGEDLYEKFLP